VDVPWKKALDVILRSQGLVYECEDNIIRVTTVENLKKEDLVTRVFDLNYANSEKVSKAIENMLGPRGKINFDERMNLLIITDVSANLGKIGEVIEKIDTPTRQVLVEAKIVEITLGKGEDLGINWSALKAVSVGTSGVRAGYERTREYDYKSGRETTDKTADKREIVDKQAIVNSARDFQGEAVFSTNTATWVAPPVQSTWEDKDARESTDTRTRTPWDKTTSLTKALTHTDMSKYIQSAVLSIDDFNLVLSALKTRGDFNLVSNPKIVTVNNQKAKIHVGQTIYIPEFKQHAETGLLTITNYEPKDVGITLEVTPNINKDKYIGLEVKPKIEDLQGWTGPQNMLPILFTKEAETKVLIKDGDTLVIGGLITEDKIEGINKVPLLGDIPFLGWLFKHKTTETNKKDLVIFITPTILGGE